jgi:hypothetical protein
MNTSLEEETFQNNKNKKNNKARKTNKYINQHTNILDVVAADDVLALWRWRWCRRAVRWQEDWIDTHARVVDARAISVAEPVAVVARRGAAVRQEEGRVGAVADVECNVADSVDASKAVVEARRGGRRFRWWRWRSSWLLENGRCTSRGRGDGWLLGGRVGRAAGLGIEQSLRRSKALAHSLGEVALAVAAAVERARLDDALGVARDGETGLVDHARARDEPSAWI